MLILLCVSLVATFVPQASALTKYYFYGVFSEWGIAEEDMTTCTAFLVGETPYRWDMNGTHVITYDTGSGVTTEINATYPFELNATTSMTSFTFDLGYNVSRIYYTNQGATENIYVIVPFSTELWNAYTFEVVDLINVDWGYLEMTLPINGTETEIERWDIKTMNDITFIMVWGKTYNIRLKCSEGTYQYPTFTAGVTQDKTITISQDMFYTAPVSISNITMSVTRNVDNRIVFNYVNAYSDTNIVNFTLFEYGNSTAIWTDTSTSDSVTSYYNYAEPKDYWAKIFYSSASAGNGTKSFSLPYQEAEPDDYDSHPFAVLRDFGNLPFDAANIPAIAILLVIAFVFSWYHLEWGLVVEIIVTVGLVYMRWLAISWSWVGVVAAIGMLLVFGERKQKEPLG